MVAYVLDDSRKAAERHAIVHVGGGGGSGPKVRPWVPHETLLIRFQAGRQDIEIQQHCASQLQKMMAMVAEGMADGC